MLRKLQIRILGTWTLVLFAGALAPLSLSAGSADDDDPGVGADEEAAESSGSEDPASAAAQDSSSQRGLEANRRFCVGMVPAGGKGLQGSLRFDLPIGYASDVDLTVDALELLKAVTFFEGTLSYGLSQKLTLFANLRVGHPYALPHVTTGFLVGARVAFEKLQRDGIPVTLGARAGLVSPSAIFSLFGWNDIFPEEGVTRASTLGSFKLDLRVPLNKTRPRLWFGFAEAAFEGDLVRREVYHSDGTMDSSTRPSLGSIQLIAGLGMGNTTSVPYLVFNGKLGVGAMSIVFDLDGEAVWSPLIVLQFAWGGLSSEG